MLPTGYPASGWETDPTIGKKKKSKTYLMQGGESIDVGRVNVRSLLDESANILFIAGLTTRQENVAIFEMDWSTWDETKRRGSINACHRQISVGLSVWKEERNCQIHTLSVEIYEDGIAIIFNNHNSLSLLLITRHFQKRQGIVYVIVH